MVWSELLRNLGYQIFRDGGTFIQFESDNPQQWNLDVMLAPAETFDRLLAAAKPATMEGAAVVVPSLEHLLALRIHVLKHGHGLRVLKDLTDVAQLAIGQSYRSQVRLVAGAV